MFYTGLYKLLPDDTNINKILIIGTAIYAIFHYLIFNKIVALPIFLQKYIYGFYVILVIDIIIFMFLYKKELDEAMNEVQNKTNQLDTLIQKNHELTEQQNIQDALNSKSNISPTQQINRQPAFIPQKINQTQLENNIDELINTAANKSKDEESNNSIEIIQQSKPEGKNTQKQQIIIDHNEDTSDIEYDKEAKNNIIGQITNNKSNDISDDEIDGVSVTKN